MALLLLMINMHFLFSSTTKHLHQPLITPFYKEQSYQNEPHNLTECVPNIKIVNNLAKITSQKASNISNICISISFQNQSSTSNISRVLSMKHSQNSGTEVSGCEIMLAGNQWTAWNLMDLCLSSASPFAFLLIFNLSIILRVTRQKAFASRLGSVSYSTVRFTNAPANAATSKLKNENQINNKREVTFSFSKLNSTCIRNSKAERSITLMLLVTTLAFLILRTPISLGNLTQMLVSEERLYLFIEPVTCMAAFAVAEILAFGQHATQFYVYFVCSARFRHALCRQLRLIFTNLIKLFPRHSLKLPDELSAPAPAPKAENREPTLPALHPLYQYSGGKCAYSTLPTQCRHEYQWEDRYLLVCRLCFARRPVHHPSCVYHRDESRFACECMSPTLQRPAHIVVHLRDHFAPLFGMAYRS